MARRALLIGSEIAGLHGVGHDLDIMTELLVDRGFEAPRRHEEQAATRAAITRAFAELVADTGPDDAVVVYYSGHGGRVVDTTAPLGGIPREFQFIAPYDFADSAAGDFRGITSLELSAHIANLTRRTENVTVVLDCCYSSRMARDTSLVPKALPRYEYVDVAAHLARIDAPHLADGLSGDVESNQDAVRLVAAGYDQQAYEYTGADGRRVGLLTDALRTLLTSAAAAPVTWASLADVARRWITPLAPDQRPEAEGPADRLLFATQVRDLLGVLPLRVAAGRATLGAGALAGVAVGDVYAARLPGASDDLARLTVVSVTAASASATITFAAGVTALRTGVEAHPVTRAGRRWPVRLAGGGPGADALRARLAASALLVPEVAEGERALVTVRIDAANATITDPFGPVTDPVPLDRSGVQLVARNIERLARAASLAALGGSDPELGASSEVGWSRVVDGEAVELPATGALLHEGDRIAVRLRNAAPEKRFFYLFSVGVGGRVNRLTNDPSGLALDPGAEWVVGHRPDAGVTGGLAVGWPSGVSRAARRPASLTVLVTDRKQDLSTLEHEGVVMRGGDPSALGALLAQVVDGGSRDVGRESPNGVRWARHDLDHLLVPAPRPEAGQVVPPVPRSSGPTA